jgi:hypothetical protein
MNSFAAFVHGGGAAHPLNQREREGVFQRSCAQFPSAPGRIDAHWVFPAPLALRKTASGRDIPASLHKILADFRSPGGAWAVRARSNKKGRPEGRPDRRNRKKP